ncbi:MAG: helix-turn-helix transcriptional regulator [Candidatus Odinarchaeota archaeon]
MMKTESRNFLSTRDKILRHLLLNGSDSGSIKQCTAKNIAKALKLTPNGVRQHIGILEKDNLVILKEIKGKTGRPAIVYALNENAMELFPKSYAEFGSLLLDVLTETYGKDFAGKLLESMGKKKAEEVKRNIPEEILSTKNESNEYLKIALGAIKSIYDGIGKFGELIEEEDRFILRNHNCLLYSIFKGDTLVCKFDEVILEELIGYKPQKEKCIRDGSGCCQFCIEKFPSSDQ